MKRYRSGFALPTVILASTAMLIVLAAALAASASISSSITQQYYQRLGLEAAEAGTVRAYDCLLGAATIPWNPATNVLTPSSSCSGVSNTATPACTAAGNSVANTSQYCTTFVVSNIQASAGGGVPYTVTVSGQVGLKRQSGDTYQSFGYPVRQTIQYRNTPSIAGGAGWKTAGHDGYMLSQDGTLYGWGDNSQYQINDLASPSYITTPQQIALPANVTRIIKLVNSGQGASYMCILAISSVDGQQVYCRGAGMGSTQPTGAPGWIQFGSAPSQVIPGSASVYSAHFGAGGLTAVDVRVQGYGADSMCVLASDGYLYCAGENVAGDLGIGPYGGVASGAWRDWTTSITTPGRFQTPAGYSVSKFIPQDTSICAIVNMSPAKLYCAGRNDWGQMMDGNTTTNNWLGYANPMPAVLASSGKTPMNVWLSYHSGSADGVFVQTTDNYWYFGGSNDLGTAADGSTNGTIYASGRQITTTFQSMFSVGEDGNARHAVCVLQPTSIPNVYPSGFWCMGSNKYGEQGTGDCVDHPGWQYIDTRDSSGNTVIPAILSDQTLQNQMYSEMAYQMNSIMFISTSGDVYAAGDNTYGKVGPNTNIGGTNCAATSSSKFQKISLPNNVKAVAFTNTDEYTSYILGNDNRVYSIGGNNNGQLGNGSTTNANTIQVVQLPVQQTLY